MFQRTGFLVGLTYLLNTVHCNIISTLTGDISGSAINVLGQEQEVYLGVPYAEPPVGDLRFKPPVPVKPWSRTYNATRNPLPCLQPNCSGNCDENCLYLNIWVPTSENNAISVMVWFYGGSFTRGSISEDRYNGSVIAAIGKVIVVTINYRLGAFGFFCSETDDARGNMGMKDQVLGLRWVKDNIGYFGGDPNNITIFGLSAGAYSVSKHLVSPMTKGLFNSAIMQSGATYIPDIIIRNSTLCKWRSAKLAVEVGCASCNQDISTDPRVMACMRSMSASSLAETDAVVSQQFIACGNPWLSIFTPVYGDDYLPNHPIKDMAAGNLHAQNLMIGNTKDEGSLFLPLLAAPYLQSIEHPALIKPLAELYILITSRGFVPSYRDVCKYYLGNTTFFDKSLLKRSYDSIGDRLFHCPAVFLAESSSARGKSVYFYNFTHRWSESKNPAWMGTTHGDELDLVFGKPFRDDSSYLPEEIEFSRDLIGCWTSFAKSGTPASGRYSGRWLPYSSNNRVAANLNPYNVSLDDPYKDACDFWRITTKRWETA